jgi:hypothetical protein
MKAMRSAIRCSPTTAGSVRLLTACLLVIFSGCSPAVDFEGSFGDVPSGGSTGNDGGGNGTGASSGGTDDPGSGSDSGGVKYDVGGGPGGGFPGGNCSGDLQSVIDPHTGEVVEECPPDQGCYDGECIPACEAAGLSQGSIGCEYITPGLPFYKNHETPTSYDGSCHALMLANTWGRPAKLGLSRDGVVSDALTHARIPEGVGPNATYQPVPATGIPVGQVAILFLSHLPGAKHDDGASLECPVTPVLVGDAAEHGTAAGMAFELESDTPLTVYDILPYGGSESYLPSASLIFPVTAWGDNYVLATPHPARHNTTNHREWALVVAEEDDTTVTFRASVAVDAGTIASPTPGVPTQYTLDRGEFVQWSTLSDLVGSVVSADRRVGVYAGNTYLVVSTADCPTGGPKDSTHQQIVHVNALAQEYVAAGIPTRLASGEPESIAYRLVGVVDGTQLVYDPAAPQGAPSTLDQGEAVEFESQDLFVVSSQDAEHPFAFTHYMSGGIPYDDAAGGCFPSDVFGDACMLGDTDWINAVPPVQFLSHYAFFIDPTYGVTSVAIVRTRGPGGFADVSLECMAAPVSGWQPLGDSGQYEVAHVDLHRGGVGACAASQQRATSTLPFGITVWGTDHAASYGYPAGGNARVINDVHVPAG